MTPLLSRSRERAPDAPPQFPLRAGAIDVGSNAMRFLAAEFTAPTTYRVLAETRAPVRLGHEVFLSGRLDRAAMEAGVEAIAGFRKRMEELGIEHYRAVATSATRESRNGDEFVARVRREAGVELEVITGTEEARLVYEAIRAQVPFGKKKWMLVDLGGGSVEVSLVDATGILWSESHTLGSVRLLEELSSSGDDPGRFQRLLEEYTATLRVGAISKQWNPAGLLATGGNIEALAKLLGADPGRGRMAAIQLNDLRGAIAMLSRLSFRQRVEQLGMREDRADVIVPAAMVYERVAALAGATEIIVPAVGLKDGILVDLVDDLTTHQAHEDRKERAATEGAIVLGTRYQFNEKHARHVARLAGSLFDQLEKVHRLEPADRRLLTVAALLHDVGIFIGHKKHHKHSLYIISQSEVPELTPRETDIVANVARYHRKGVPAAHHQDFNRLSSDDRGRVVKLASLLRIADALDREHLQAVTGVTATAGKGRLALELEGSGDLLLERWALRQKAGLFTEAFGLEVEVAD